MVNSMLCIFNHNKRLYYQVYFFLMFSLKKILNLYKRKTLRICSAQFLSVPKAACNCLFIQDQKEQISIYKYTTKSNKISKFYPHTHPPNSIRSTSFCFGGLIPSVFTSTRSCTSMAWCCVAWCIASPRSSSSRWCVAGCRIPYF